jgi:hypothetical protein
MMLLEAEESWLMRVMAAWCVRSVRWRRRKRRAQGVEAPGRMLGGCMLERREVGGAVGAKGRAGGKLRDASTRAGW